MAARLKDFYKAEVAPELAKKFSYKSPMQIRLCFIAISARQVAV